LQPGKAVKTIANARSDDVKIIGLILILHSVIRLF